MLEGSFEINPYEIPRSCLVEDIPFPKYQIIYSHIFSAQCLKRYWKSSRCGPRESERRKETAFFNPKGMVSTLAVSFMGFPLGVNFEFMVS